jgi:hypothetical protein
MYYNNIGVFIDHQDGLNSIDELFDVTKVSPLNNYRPNFRISVKGKIYENETEVESIHLDSISTLEGGCHRNILHLKYPNSLTIEIYSDMYYAKNIGLVKFVRSNNNSIWELIRYKINQ